MPVVRLKSLQEAARRLQDGELVVYPTETALALGADATNAEAAAKIYEVKTRSASKALTLICADTKMVKRFLEISPVAKELVAVYWPGPLTVILKPYARVHLQHLGPASRGIGVRVPNNALARNLSGALGKPLVATSANLSGQPSAYSFRRIQQYFKKSDRPIFYYGPNRIPRRSLTTIVDARTANLKIIRQGKLRPKLLY